MALIDYFSDWLTDEVTVQLGEQDDNGAFSIASTQTWDVWIRRQVEVVRDAKGNEISAKVRLIGAPVPFSSSDYDDPSRCRFVLPVGAGTEGPLKALSIVPRFNETALDYEVVYL